MHNTILNFYHRLHSKSLGLLFIRLAAGALFIYAGWFKLTHMSMIIPAMASMGIPAWLTWVVALLEFIGGIMVIIGWWAKFFSGALFVILVVAMIMTKGWSLGTPAGNLDWVLLATLAAIFVSGCGRWSLCAWKHHKNCAPCKENGTCDCAHQ